MSKITKSLDVSDLSDDHIKNLEKVAAMSPETIALLTGPEQKKIEVVEKQRDELTRIIKRVIEVFERTEDPICWGSVSPREYGRAIREVVTDAGINLDYKTIKP